MKKEIFYISNLLSLSRFLLAGFCSYYLINNNYKLTLVFIVLIWFSDLLDGYIARKRGEISELGKIIDPLADKTVIIVVVLILLFKGIIPTYYVIITVFRDAIILAGGLYLKYSKNIVLQSNWVGKIAVFSIGLTLLLAVFKTGSQTGQFGNYFLYHNEITELLYSVLILLSIGMAVVSLFSYFQRFIKS